MAEINDKTKVALTVRDVVSAIALIVSVAGLYFAINTRLTILEERDKQRNEDFTEMKSKVDKIYDIVIKLDK